MQTHVFMVENQTTLILFIFNFFRQIHKNCRQIKVAAQNNIFWHIINEQTSKNNFYTIIMATLFSNVIVFVMIKSKVFKCERFDTKLTSM